MSEIGQRTTMRMKGSIILIRVASTPAGLEEQRRVLIADWRVDGRSLGMTRNSLSNALRTLVEIQSAHTSPTPSRTATSVEGGSSAGVRTLAQNHRQNKTTQVNSLAGSSDGGVALPGLMLFYLIGTGLAYPERTCLSLLEGKIDAFATYRGKAAHASRD